jgi:hypothetical protein
MPAGDYLKGKYSKRTKTVMPLLRQGHLSQTKIALMLGERALKVFELLKHPRLAEVRKQIARWRQDM